MIIIKKNKANLKKKKIILILKIMKKKINIFNILIKQNKSK